MRKGNGMIGKWAWTLHLAAALFAGFSVNALAQAPPAASSSGPSRILLDVLVSDKAGNPVSGLTREDFKLLDSREPVTVRSFTAHAPGDGSENGMFVVIDNLNSGFGIATSELLQLETYLDKSGKLSLPVAVFLLTDSGILQVTQFSANGPEVADRLRHTKATVVPARLKSGFRADQERMNTSLNSFTKLVAGLGSIYGHKVVVWLGPGWPVIDSSEADFGPQQQAFCYTTAINISNALREEQIIVDLVSQVGSVTASGANEENGRELFWESFLKPLTKETKAEAGYLALQVFAIYSGGTVVLGSNDLGKEIARTAQDATSWYTLTFDSEKAPAPNTWYDVEVKIDKPQVKVRTTNGYYAQP